MITAILLGVAIATTAGLGNTAKKKCFEIGVLTQDAIAQHCHDNEELDGEGAFAE